MANFPANIRRTSPSQEILFGSTPTGGTPVIPSFILTTLTPASDSVFGELTSYDVILGRGGNDSIWGYDQSLSPVKSATNIDVEFGQTEAITSELVKSLLNTIAGNPVSGGKDRFVLGDANRSFYTNNGYNDFAFIADFNPKSDVIQLHGSAKDYDFVNIPILGEAIFAKTAGSSQSVFNGDLIGVVLGASNLDPNGANFKYVGNTAPPGPVQSKIKQIGTAGYDIASSVATDSFGNVYVTGATNGSLGGTNAGSFDYWVAKYDTKGNQAWIKQYGTPQYDIAQNITTDNDKSGNFFVVGATGGNLAGPLQGQQEDAFIGKYDSNGNQLWTVQLGENVFSGATNVTTDNAGNVYVSGITLNSDTRTSAVSPYEDDSWLVKYDTNGKQQWFTQIATPPQFPAIWEEAYGVALGPDASVYTTGWTYGGLGGNNSGAPGNYDAWITKYSQATGDVQWIKQFGAGAGNQTNDTFAWNVATDSKGNVYDYGWTQGSLGKTITGQSDLFLAKFDSNGNQLWVKQFGASNADNAAYIGGLKIDKYDHLFLTGYTNGSAKGTNAGSYDAFVSRFDTNGNQIWNQQFGTAQLDYATNIAVGNANDVYVTGLTEGSLGAINKGSTDGFVAKLSATTGALVSFNPGASSSSPLAAQSVADTQQVIPNRNVGPNAVTDPTSFTNRFLSALDPKNLSLGSSSPNVTSDSSAISGSGTINATQQNIAIAGTIYNTLVGALSGGAIA